MECFGRIHHHVRSIPMKVHGITAEDEYPNFHYCENLRSYSLSVLLKSCPVEHGSTVKINVMASIVTMLRYRRLTRAVRDVYFICFKCLVSIADVSCP